MVFVDINTLNRGDRVRHHETDRTLAELSAAGGLEVLDPLNRVLRPYVANAAITSGSAGDDEYQTASGTANMLGVDQETIFRHEVNGYRYRSDGTTVDLDDHVRGGLVDVTELTGPTGALSHANAAAEIVAGMELTLTDGGKRRASAATWEVIDGGTASVPPNIVKYVDTVADLATTVGIADEPWLVRGFASANDAGDPWAWIYRTSGRAGVTLTAGSRVAGPGADDWWEVADQMTFYSGRWGIKTDAQDAAHDASISIGDLIIAAAAAGAEVVIDATPGTHYNLKTPKQVPITDNVRIHAEGAAFIGTSPNDTLSISPSSLTSLAWNGSLVPRAQNEITVVDATGVEVGDLLSFHSPVEWENAWFYQKYEVHRVRSITGNTITTEDKIVFNYDPFGTPTADVMTIEHARPVGIHWTGGAFKNAAGVANQAARFLQMRNLTGSKVENSSAIDPFGRRIADHYWATGCLDTEFNEITVAGTRYSITIPQGSRNTRLKGLYSTDTRHPFDPSQAAYGVYAEKIRGHRNNATLSLHAAFEVHVTDVIGINDDNIGFRAIGGSMTDVLHESNVPQPSESYYSNVSFNNPESSIDDVYGEHPIHYKNVKVRAPGTAGFDVVLRVNVNQETTVEDCEFPWIRAGSSAGLGQLTVARTKAHAIQARNFLDANDVEFIYEHPFVPVARRVEPPIYGNSAQRWNLTKCKFLGAYPHVVDANRPLVAMFRNCLFDGITTDFASANLPNSHIDIGGSTVKNCTWPATAPSMDTVTVFGSGAIDGGGNAAHAMFFAGPPATIGNPLTIPATTVGATATELPVSISTAKPGGGGALVAVSLHFGFGAATQSGLYFITLPYNGSTLTGVTLVTGDDIADFTVVNGNLAVNGKTGVSGNATTKAAVLLSI